jgi:predicted lipoprotein with Yx(FWY)xxD motif
MEEGTMRRFGKSGTLLVFVLVFVIGVGAAYAHRSTANGTVNLRATPLGKVLVSANGRALYLFRRDKTTKSTCYGMCATDWPPLLTKVAKPAVGSGVKASLVGTTRRKDGKRQVTYRGHPLYRFFLDKRAGQTKGQGQDFFGGKWYVMNAKGLAIVKAATATTTTTSGPTTTSGTTTTSPYPGGGGGYP